MLTLNNLISMQGEFALPQYIKILQWFEQKAADNNWLGYETIRQTESGYLMRLVFDPQLAAENWEAYREMMTLWNFVPREKILVGYNCSQCGYPTQGEDIEECPVCHATKSFVAQYDYPRKRAF